MASGTRSRTAAQACLLRLPDPCLLAVMQCCASDIPSTLSAAPAHSRLQQAAVEALSSISAGQLGYARVESFLLYLAKHGQHVRSLALHGQHYDVQLLELPPSLTKLDSLQLNYMYLQLQPDVLRAGLPLTRLELSECTLLDGAQGLVAALMQLPDLQHLNVAFVYDEHEDAVLPTAVLSHLTNLTSLTLRDEGAASSSDVSAALGSLQALTRLVDLDLSLGFDDSCVVTADMLSGAGQLTRLSLSLVNPDRALAGRTQLQHLSLRCCSLDDTGVAQLLSEVQHLTQLTHLDLHGSCWSWADEFGPKLSPAAYASLTASSRLQHLDLSCGTLPSAAWQYVCPPGRTLPQLRYLDITGVEEADESSALPDTSALVSCCPGLQILKTNMPCSTAQLAPLSRLTGLHTLAVGAVQADGLVGVQVLCQLTGLQQLEVCVRAAAEARILQLTQLTRLTALTFPHVGVRQELRCNPQDPGSEPVWRQLLRQFADHPDLVVAQQAAAALEAA